MSPANAPVSALGLGSWNTYNRITFEDVVLLLRTALDLGINLFDVAFYWDGLHTDVLFGRAIQATGAARGDYLVAEKVWLWWYPQESLAGQVKRSLRRLGMDYIDIAMLARPLPGMDMGAFAEEAAGLVKDGLARAWGIENWEAGQASAVWRYCRDHDVPVPGLLQLQYNVARRSIVETADYDQLFEQTGIRLSPADTLEGGILCGHLQRERVDPADMAKGIRPVGRNIARDAGGIRPAIRGKYALLQQIAARLDATPAQVAIAFCLAHPATGTVLLGASRPEQLTENAGAISLLERSGPELLAMLDPLIVDGGRHPQLFKP
jgi:L-glyceraldehyde 3-phosphate reductase